MAGRKTVGHHRREITHLVEKNERAMAGEREGSLQADRQNHQIDDRWKGLKVRKKEREDEENKW